MGELWDVYNKDREYQNKTIRRGESFGEGEYYVCCEAWIVNSKDEMLVTKRHPNKKAGGLWEFVGGGVLAGENTAEACVREVKEEIGVLLEPSELSLFQIYRQKNYFMDIYLVKKDLKIQNIVFGKDEAVDAKWVSREELRNMIENQEFVRSVALRYNLFRDQF